METGAALALQATAADIVRAAAEADAAGTAAAAGSDSLLSSAAGGASGGTMEPPPVQVGAAGCCWARKEVTRVCRFLNRVLETGKASAQPALAWSTHN